MSYIIDPDELMVAAEESMFGMGNAGFCIACGEEADGGGAGRPELPLRSLRKAQGLRRARASPDGVRDLIEPSLRRTRWMRLGVDSNTKRGKLPWHNSN